MIGLREASERLGSATQSMRQVIDHFLHGVSATETQQKKAA